MLAHSTKNFYTFPPGTRFKAVVLNIQPGRVTIRLDGGGSFTARSLVLPDARIGEAAYFQVKTNNLDGLIELMMIKGTPAESRDKLVQEALTNSGLVTEGENIEIGRALMDNNLPLDSENLQKAAFFKYAILKNENISQSRLPSDKEKVFALEHMNDDYMAVQKAMFLMREGFDTAYASNSIKALNASLNPSQHMGKLLQNISDSPTVQKIVKPAEFFVPLSTDPKVLINYYTNLRETLARLYKEISKLPPSTELTNVRDMLAEVREHLLFVAKLSGKTRYYQIPFMSGPQAELFISADKELLIGMDTINLGRIEVIKKGQSLQICAESDAILNQIKANSHKLPGVNLSYQKRNERTTLINPQIFDTSKDKPEVKRFAFDMRV